MYGTTSISGACRSPSNAHRLHFYPNLEAASLDEWLFFTNGRSLPADHFPLPDRVIFGLHGARQWELSYRLACVPDLCRTYQRGRFAAFGRLP